MRELRLSLLCLLQLVIGKSRRFAFVEFRQESWRPWLQREPPQQGNLSWQRARSVRSGLICAQQNSNKEKAVEDQNLKNHLVVVVVAMFARLSKSEEWEDRHRERAGGRGGEIRQRRILSPVFAQDKNTREREREGEGNATVRLEEPSTLI